MIYKLISYNLKKQDYKHNLWIIFSATILTIAVIEMNGLSKKQGLVVGDIMLLVYGGVTRDFFEVFDISTLVIFIMPHIIIIYLVQKYFSEIIEKTPRSIFIRIKSLTLWNISINISLIYVVIKDYILLFLTTFIVSMIFLNSYNFEGNYLVNRELNELTVNIGQQDILVKMFILNVISMCCFILICNNIYYISKKSDTAVITFILVNIFMSTLNRLPDFASRLLWINQLIIKRHDMFMDGYSRFTFKYSVLYMCIMIIVNLGASDFFIKRQDF